MIGIISDIHGNLPALQAVLAALAALGADRLVCAGDVAGYYPFINECCQCLREAEALVVQGNHDFYLATGTPCPRSRSANDCLAYQARVITPENRAWLGSLAPAGRLEDMEIVHGGWRDPLDEYLVPDAAYFRALEGRRFVSGHSHVQTLWQGEGAVWCNPGSVGQPRDGDPRAAFATFDGEAFTLHRVAYPVEQTMAAMARAGFNDYYFRNLAHGLRIGATPDQACPGGAAKEHGR
ncbi:MAG: metallophosphoesterase [Desulfovibrionaceae bacterium]|jgi:predicted phosphodiesterase